MIGPGKINVFGDWLEATECNYAYQSSENTHSLRIRISQISKVVDYDPEDNCKNECMVIMRNGNKHHILCDYHIVCAALT